MTVVIAWKDGKGGVWMGADRCASSGNGQQNTLNRPKIVRTSWGAIGVSGSIGIVLALATKDLKTALGEPADVETFAVQNVAPLLRDIEEATLWPGKEKSEGWKAGFLVVVHGRIFTISWTGVCEYADPYAAMGSGTPEARSALATQEIIMERQGWSLPPEGRMQIALEVASRHDDGCRPPFDIMYINPPGEEP